MRALTMALMTLLPPPAAPMQAAAARAKAALLQKHGERERARIERGVNQVASLWRACDRDERSGARSGPPPSGRAAAPACDGDEAAFVRFMEEQFVADPALLDATFERFEYALEQLDGHFHEISRELSRWAVLDIGPMIELDKQLGAFEAAAHAVEDLF